MKSTFFLLLVVLASVGSSPVLAQRHIRGMNAVGGHYGPSGTGRFAELSYARFLRDKTYLRFGLTRESGTLAGRGDFSAYGLRLAIAPTLFHVGQTAYVHMLYGVAVQYERKGQNQSAPGAEPGAKLPQSVTAGPYVGLEGDVFLGNHVSLVATATKGYLLLDPLISHWPGMLTGGVRLHFY
jgi:hypothetical protein